MNKKDLLIYRIITGLFSVMILLGVSQYFFNHEMVKGMYEALEFPPYLIYPLGIAKVLGLVAIWGNFSTKLKEWAYAGFTFNLLLGISAHINVQDGEAIGAAIALVLLLVSYFFNRKTTQQSA